jgi:transcriptional regulator with XRE-family HTH domain
MGATKLQRQVRIRDLETRRAIGTAVRSLREDAALTRVALANAAGIDPSFEGRIETGARAPGITTLAALATVLGADLSIRLYPTTGPMIRDHLQAAMVEALLRTLHSRWHPIPEVPVTYPARGVIDLVLAERASALLIAAEVHSEVRRLEQQLRWHREKELSLASSTAWRVAEQRGEPTTSRLLVLRSTRTLRDLANTYEATLRAAYPARAREIAETLQRPGTPWPGPGILWARVEAGRAEILPGPPRGVLLGR